MPFRPFHRSPGSTLSSKIFLSMIGIIVFSLLCFSIFWFNERASRFRSEVVRMKKNFSESKMLEIRNKILQIKDYIRWISHTEDSAVSLALARQARQLSAILADSGGCSASDETTLARRVLRQQGAVRIPLAVYHRSGRRVCEDRQGSLGAGGELPASLPELAEKAGKGTFGQPGRVSFLHQPGLNGDVITGALMVDTVACPGYRVVFLLPATSFRTLLQQFLLDSISRMRYAVNEYVFVNTLQGEALVTHGRFNPKPIRILSSGDTAWIRIFNVQRLSAYRPEGIFHTYRWKKLSSDTLSVKTSYFSCLHEWQWIIGTGFYEDDIHSVIARQRDELRRHYRYDVLNMLLYLLAFSLLSYILVLFISRRLRRNIALFTSFFRKSAEESVLIDVQQVSYGEFRILAEAANRMVQQREEIAKALRASEAHYRYLFEKNPAPMLIYELGSLRLLAINDAFTNHYGYTAEDVTTMDLTDLYPADEKEPIARLTARLTGHAYAGEWHHIRKDGSVITIEAHSHDISFEGRPGRVAVLSDITQRKKDEAEIQKLNQELEYRVRNCTLQLEATNRELESFSYSVSHDLRAPLRAIQGFASILEEDYRETLDEEGRRLFDSIIQNTLHMNRLIDGLLALSRIGKEELKCTRIDMAVMAVSVYGELTAGADLARIRFLVAPLPPATGDPVLIRQVWTNLLSNALKYSSRREEPVIDIGFRLAGDTAEYFIRDNGVGFDSAAAGNLFRVFQRFHSTREYEGTGIGLATVDRIIRRHGGRVWAESEPGKGATFFFTLQG